MKQTNLNQGTFYAFCSGRILFVKDFINYGHNVLEKKKASLKTKEES